MKPGTRAIVLAEGDREGDSGTVVDAPDLRGRDDVVALSFADDLTDSAQWHLFPTDQVEPAP